MSDIELDYGAITIDNCIFKSEGYKLDEGLLRQMVQFKNGPVQVIQTDIVHNEARKHLAENIGKARTSISQALRTAAKQLKIRQTTIDAATEMLTIPGDDAEVAENRLLKYYERIGAETLKSSDYIDFERLIDMYFGVKAPFESVKDKKSEFPDAIALISLEKWAIEKGIKIIAVSNDGGWNNFSVNSAVIKVVQNLSDAIALFQPHNKVNDIIARIREDALLDEKNHVLGVIEREIVNSLIATKTRNVLV